MAEDRDRFRKLLIKLKLKQADSGIAKTYNEAIKIASDIGLPLVVRPSYVLGGRAMEIVHEKNQLKDFVQEAFKARANFLVCILSSLKRFAFIDTGGKQQAESPE